MAVRRPLKSITGGIQEFSDSELEYLSYQTRVAYATYLYDNSAGYGAIYVGSTGLGGEVNIGSHSDTKKTQQVSSDGDGGFTGGDSDAGHGPDEGEAGTGPPTSHDPGDYPAAPGVGSTTVTSYTYSQEQAEPSTPSASDFDSYGYIINESAGTLRVEHDEQNIYDTFLTACINEMRNTDGNGDEVGTYRISTSAPSSGGAGTWSDMGSWFVDTTYSGTQATYKLWLKRSLTTVPGTDTMPLVKSGTNLQQKANEASSDLIQQVLLPILQRKITESLAYTVTSTNVTARNRGTFNDTRLNSDTTTYQTGPGDTYRTFSTPSGSATNHSTKYLLIV